MNSYPDNNPKSAVGMKKTPMHLVPPSAKFYLALAFEDGAHKYGPYNWRDTAVSVSTYLAAFDRHFGAYLDGEDVADDSGIPHLAHAMACLAILLDAKSVGKLIDDRPTPGAMPSLLAEYATTRKRPPEDPSPAAVVIDPDPPKQPHSGFALGKNVTVQLSIGDKKFDFPATALAFESKRPEPRVFGELPASFSADINLSEADAASINAFIDYMDKHSPSPIFPQPGVYEDPDYPGKSMIVGDDGYVYRGCTLLAHEWGDSADGVTSKVKFEFFDRRNLASHPAMSEALRQQDEAQLIRN